MAEGVFLFWNKQAPYIEAYSHCTSRTLDGFHIQQKTCLYSNQGSLSRDGNGDLVVCLNGAESCTQTE